MFRKVLLALGAILFAGLMTLLATGFTSPSLLTPKDNLGFFRKINEDGWIQEGAKILLPRLNSRGNTLTIKFNNWHPADKPQPHVKVSVCGSVASEFFVTPGSEHLIYLTGQCDPREISFNFYNPFQASASDNRLVGAQLDSVKINSKLGLPLVGPMTFVAIFVAIFYLSLFASFIFGSRLEAPAFIATTSLFAFLIGNADNFNVGLWIPVWIVILLGIIGAYLLSNQRDPSQRSGLIYTLIFAAVIAAGAALRVYGIDFGLPNTYHLDELQKYQAIKQMYESGQLNPKYFLHPSLLLYLTYGLNWLTNQIAPEILFLESIIISGRTVSCIAGVLSIYLVFKIANSLWNSRAGLVAASLMATFPLAVTCSRYLKEDSLLTFVILLTVFLTIKAAERGSIKYLLLAGIAAGLSASVKYSGILSIFILWGHPFICRNSSVSFGSRITSTAIASLIVPLGFLIGTPYALIDSPKFLADFAYERNHMISGHSSAITAASHYWMFHVKHSLLNGMTFLNLMLGIMAMGAIFRKFKFPALYILALFLLYYLPAEFVRAKPAPQPERYILPCLPFMALAIAWLFETGRETRLRAFSSLMVIFGIVISSYRSMTLASEITPDTRDQAAKWLTQVVEPSETVLIDWEAYGPQLKDTKFKLQYADPTKFIIDLAVDNLKNSSADYLVLSSLHYDRYFSQPGIPEVYRNVVRDIFSRYPRVAEFSAESGTYGFHNPRISIFKLKE